MKLSLNCSQPRENQDPGSSELSSFCRWAGGAAPGKGSAERRPGAHPAASLAAGPHLGLVWRQQPQVAGPRPQVLHGERGAVAAPRDRVTEAQLGRGDAHPAHVPPPLRHGPPARQRPLSNGRAALIGGEAAERPKPTNLNRIRGRARANSAGFVSVRLGSGELGWARPGPPGPG